ncbi:MAG: hypothetical protein P8Y36_09020 [Alphaproteobacteria bacterium]
MSVILFIVAGLGVIAGFNVRAGGLIFLSALLFVITVAGGIVTNYSILLAVAMAFALTFTLQLSYLTSATIFHSRQMASRKYSKLRENVRSTKASIGMGAESNQHR